MLPRAQTQNPELPCAHLHQGTGSFMLKDRAPPEVVFRRGYELVSAALSTLERRWTLEKEWATEKNKQASTHLLFGMKFESLLVRRSAGYLHA